MKRVRYPLSEESLGLFYAAGTALGWALLAIGLKAALLHASSGTIACFRLISAALVLTVYYFLTDKDKLSVLKSPPPLGILAGLCLGANYFGYMKGIELVGAGYAQIMIQMAPFCLALVGFIVFKESPKFFQVLGILLTIGGFFIFYFSQSALRVNDLMSTKTESSSLLVANLWIIAAAFTWTLFAALQKWVIKGVAPQQLNLLVYWTAGIALLPLVNFSEIGAWSLGVWILMTVCGLNTILAYGFLSEALLRAPASKVSVVISSNPLLTLFLLAQLAPLELYWLKPEQLDAQSYLGAAFVVCGVIATFLKKKNRQKLLPQMEID